MDRQRNDGDLYRNLTNVQSALIGAGLTPRIDVPAFYAVEARTDLSRYGIDNGTSFDLIHQGWGVLLAQETFVILGTSAIYGLVTLACFVPLLLLVAKALRFRIPELGIGALGAAILVASLAIDEWGRTLETGLIAAAFVLSFALSYWPKLAKTSVSVGVFSCVLAIVLEATDEYTSWSEAVVPSIIFVVGTIRYYWLRGKPRRRGVWLGMLGVLFATIAAVDIRFSELGWENLIGGIALLLVAVVAVAAWCQVQLTDACRSVFKSIPYAMLVAVLFLAYCSVRQYFLVSEMHELMRDQEAMVADWKDEVSKVGPPVHYRY
ncbi:MAG: hypothetical protein M3R13_06145 [Armatimonadota bacterium]|nr:hypothetical protein [Armatimonadota bacterium]